MSQQYKLIRCNINGKDVEKMVDVRASLTDMLRNDYHLTSVKKGCEVGECGACTVLIDGETFNSCIYLAVWADGKHIRTLEGLLSPDGDPSDIQKAFMEESAIQCGFCTPGFLMTAVEILDSGKLYSDEELRKLLSGHLCRCTGYENIFKAVKKTMLRRLGMLDDPFLGPVRPSSVVMCLPSAHTARYRQELKHSPSISTLQAPHSPTSQPFFTEVM